MANKPPFNGEWVKLGDVATYVNGYAFKPADYSSEGLPIVRIQDLTGNAYQTNKFNGSIPDKYRIVSGDVLISWSASLGVYVWDKGEAYLNQHIFKVNFDKTKMNKSFFVHQATRLIKKSANQAHGATMTHLTKKVFEALPFWLPTETEQILIAEQLTSVKNQIELALQQKEVLDQLIKSRFVEMFGDPSDVRNNPLWPVYKVIEKCKCIVPARNKPKIFDGNIPWITTEDLQQDSITYNSCNNLGLSREAIAEVGQKTIPAGSVIISCVGRLGICSIAGCEMVINQQLHSFQCGPDVNNIYLARYLSYQVDYMQRTANSVTVPYMNKNACNSIPLLLPPLPLQQEFADFVAQVNKSQFVVQQQIDKLQTLYDSLAQEYFG